MEIPGTITRRRRMNVLVLLVYVLLGVYFLNFPLKFFQVPQYLLTFNDWIIFVGGLLMLFGAVNYFKAKRGVF